MSDTIIDQADFRRILGHYPTGVCVVTSVDAAGAPLAMVVGSFTSVSLDPPLVGFFPALTARSWPPIRATGRFCINILAADQEALCRRFTAPVAERFSGVAHRLSRAGLPILDQVVAWIDCTLHEEFPTGDHALVLGRVQAMAVERPAPPLLFFRGGYGRFAAASDAVTNAAADAAGTEASAADSALSDGAADVLAADSQQVECR